jgi:hypothetical protein
MKRNAMLVLLVCVVIGCVASRETTPAPSKPQVSNFPHLDENSALSIGKRFAEEKGWVIVRSPAVATLDKTRGEWSMRFRIRNGDFIGVRYVSVNDQTHEVHYWSGE